MSDREALRILQEVAKKLGCVLLPVGCVRKHEVSHVLDWTYPERFPDDAEYIAREVDNHLAHMLADAVQKIATKETGIYPRLPGTRTSLHLMSVDMPAYRSWADSHGLKPFLTPHGFNFHPL